MRSKYIFEDKKKELSEEVKLFEAHSESRELNKERCTHKGKVSIVDGVLKCTCGACWGGPQIETLYKLLNRDIL